MHRPSDIAIALDDAQRKLLLEASTGGALVAKLPGAPLALIQLHLVTQHMNGTARDFRGYVLELTPLGRLVIDELTKIPGRG